MSKEIIQLAIAAFALLLAWTSGPRAQELITDPSQLTPSSILDDYSLEMPDLVANILREADLVYQYFELPLGERLVFQERGHCHQSGCLVVVVSIEENRMFDPMVFVARGEDWYNDDLSPSSSRTGNICVSGQYAFFC